MELKLFWYRDCLVIRCELYVLWLSVNDVLYDYVTLPSDACSDIAGEVIVRVFWN
jgi:hypothetical protein